MDQIHVISAVEAATNARRRWYREELSIRDANGRRYPAPFRSRRHRAGAVDR